MTKTQTPRNVGIWILGFGFWDLLTSPAHRLHRHDGVMAGGAALDFDFGLRPLGAAVGVLRIDADLVLDLHFRVFLVRVDHYRGELSLRSEERRVGKE